jgi:hypothetical protein
MPTHSSSPSAVPDEELMRALYHEHAGPLFAYAAMVRGDIDHFEVRTSDGRRLVEVDA